MELFHDFDDDVFEKHRNRDSRTKLVSYNAKLCESEWFTKGVLTEDSSSDEKLQVIKYKAELLYHRQQYSEALSNFDVSLEFVKAHNLPVRRDIDESRCRSLLYLARPKDALHIALHLHKESQTYDQKTNSLALIMKCYDEMHLISCAISCIQRILALHPLNPEYWIQLAEHYEQLTATLLRSERTFGRHSNHISLHNPDYPCRNCVYENCAICCNYKHDLKESTKQQRSCDHCPSQDLAPEVECYCYRCICFGRTDDCLCVVLKLERGCTLLLQTPHPNQSGQGNKSCTERKHLELSQCRDVDKLSCEVNHGLSIENEQSDDVYCADRNDETTTVFNIEIRRYISISLTRARYLLKNIEMNLVSFAKMKYQKMISAVEEKLAALEPSSEENAFYEKWTSNDFGLDSQGKHRSSSPNDGSKSQGKQCDIDRAGMIRKPEEVRRVIESDDRDVSKWFLRTWLTPQNSLQIKP